MRGQTQILTQIYAPNPIICEFRPKCNFLFWLHIPFIRGSAATRGDLAFAQLLQVNVRHHIGTRAQVLSELHPEALQPDKLCAQEFRVARVCPLPDLIHTLFSIVAELIAAPLANLVI